MCTCTCITFVLLFFKVFAGSGFTRTLCGLQWGGSLLAGSTTGRFGCCSPGTFMAQPNLHPFSKATACESCPVGRYSSESDDLSCPFTATSCPVNTFAIEPALCVTSIVPIPDGTCLSTRSSCPIIQAVDAYLCGSTGSYGPIEEWDTSLVSDMSYVFYSIAGSFNTFNANISAWNVGKVLTMRSSTYLPPPRPPYTDHVLIFFYPFCINHH